MIKSGERGAVKSGLQSAHQRIIFRTLFVLIRQLIINSFAPTLVLSRLQSYPDQMPIGWSWGSLPSGLDLAAAQIAQDCSDRGV
jgi:hypothetical protein